MKKNRAFLSRKGLNTFPTLKALCSWLSPAEHLSPCCQYTPPSEQRPSRLHSPNYPMFHPENWWLGALLSNSGAQTAAGKWGWVREETKEDLDGLQWTKHSSAKTELLYAPPIHKAKYSPWVSTLTIRCMHSNGLQHQKDYHTISDSERLYTTASYTIKVLR